MHRRKLGLLPTATLLLVLALALAACGQTQTTLAGNPNTTARPRATATTTRTGSPTPAGMPYSFNSAWHLQHGAPANLNTFVFAASQPTVGYGCVGGTGNPPTNVSGPALLVTRDGGATWTPSGSYPLGTTQCQVFSDPADANDIFVVEPSNYAGFSQGQATYTPDAWRSRDGGTTWNKLAAIMIKQTRVGISNLTVLGSRLIASVVPAVPSSSGAIWDDLVASDDGGAAWQQIGQSMKPNGQIGTFVSAGSTLFASVQPGCTPCTYIDSAQRLPARSVPSRSWLMAPASSFSTNSYYRSTDAGATWTKVDGLPANANLHGLSFAPSQPHQGEYVGVAIADSMGATGINRSLYYTVDSGQTWRPVPSFDGVGGGWPDPRTFGDNGQITVLPDQALFVGAIHTGTGLNGVQNSDAGIFRLGLEASGEWLPYAPNSVSGSDGSTGFVGQWQVVPNGNIWRIWGVAYGSAASSGLTYLDVS